jgi:hypothetical protein
LHLPKNTPQSTPEADNISDLRPPIDMLVAVISKVFVSRTLEFHSTLPFQYQGQSRQIYPTHPLIDIATEGGTYIRLAACIPPLKGP